MSIQVFLIFFADYHIPSPQNFTEILEIYPLINFSASMCDNQTTRVLKKSTVIIRIFVGAAVQH